MLQPKRVLWIAQHHSGTESFSMDDLYSLGTDVSHLFAPDPDTALQMLNRYVVDAIVYVACDEVAREQKFLEALKSRREPVPVLVFETVDCLTRKDSTSRLAGEHTVPIFDEWDPLSLELLKALGIPPKVVE